MKVKNMTPFKTKKISNCKIIAIVNVGSYKVRTVICSFSFSGIKIVGYGEKRQSRLDIVNNEINNISGVCETIRQSILKAEQEFGSTVENIVINPFLCNTFYYSKKIHKKQANPDSKINIKKLFHIVDSIEKQSLHSIFHDISSKSGFAKNDLQIILGNISEIKIDGKKTKNLIEKSGEDIKVRILNMLIPKKNYELTQDIANFLDKKIFKIIPEEYAITKIGIPKSKVVFINIGNSSTFITVTHKGSLSGSIKLDIGIHDLIKSITQKSDKNRGEIIKKLDRPDLFKDDKKVFLSLFTELITAGIKEIIGENICPHHFLLTGGGANNQFIKEHISKIDFIKYGIKIPKKVDFITVSIDKIKHIIGVEDILKISNLTLISQIICTHKILSTKKDPTEQALKKSIEKIEF